MLSLCLTSVLTDCNTDLSSFYSKYYGIDQHFNVFQELLLAAEWAKLNNVPFPPIDQTVVDREGLKECYVFENKDDPRCPIILHFVLVNIHFREFSQPGMAVVSQVIFVVHSKHK